MKATVLHETPTAKHVIGLNENTARLYARAIRRRSVKWNYANVYKDVHGLGIQLAVADWVDGSYVSGLSPFYFG